MYNPCIRGWINYYSNFYRTQLRSTLTRIDLYVIRWARGAGWTRRTKREKRARQSGSLETSSTRNPASPRAVTASRADRLEPSLSRMLGIVLFAITTP
jgi:hypothetical protein